MRRTAGAPGPSGFVAATRTRTRIALAIAIGWALGSSACRPPDPVDRIRAAEALAAAAGLERLEADGTSQGVLPVVAWRRTGRERRCLRVYLEGDGLAWQRRRRVSRDPTPVDPVGLRLAAADDSNATVVYVGRPCQYVGSMETAAAGRGAAAGDAPGRSRCRPIVWTAARYGEEVLRAMDAALTRAIEGEAPTDLTLVGHSGGGVVAALLAARRDDVTRLVTVASPLDVDHWTRVRAVSPLVHSHSPMDSIEALRAVEQQHFIGLGDERVPASAIERFHDALGPGAPSRVHRWADVDHLGWPLRWRDALVRARLPCSG